MCHPKPPTPRQRRARARKASRHLPTVSRPNQTGIYPGQTKRHPKPGPTRKPRKPRRFQALPPGWTLWGVVTWPVRLADHQVTCRWRRFCGLFVTLPASTR